MLHEYHAAMLEDTLNRFFSRSALDEIIAANLGQDGLPTIFGHDYIHFDASKFKEALAYIEDQHALVAAAAGPGPFRAAFGRLTHGAQDFYAHSNYVDLWLDEHGGLENTRPQDIDGLDTRLLDSPRLHSGSFYWWRDIIYYIPGLRGFARQYLVFAGSHEAMHLDDPSRGPRFEYAIQAARQRTLAEYARAVRALTPGQLSIFHGQPAAESGRRRALAAQPPGPA